MRAFPTISAAALMLLPAAGYAEPTANPLIGEWQMEGRANPALRSYQHMLFAPTAMILDRANAVAVRGYDAAGAVRVRTDRGGDLLFIVDEADRICLAETAGLQSLPSRPMVKAGDRCFARRVPARS